MIRAAIVAFLGMCVLDLVWAHYTRAMAQRHAWRGAFLASAMICISGVVTLSYVTDWRMLLPAAAGAFVGTFVGTKEWKLPW